MTVSGYESKLFNSYCVAPGRGGGGWGGVLRISSDRDDGRIFLGLKFFISGLFWVKKFWQVFFWQLYLSRDFFGHSK